MTEQAIKLILENGLLGALIILLGTCVIKLYGKLEKERNERLATWKEVWQEDIKFRTELKNLLDRIFEILKGG